MSVATDVFEGPSYDCGTEISARSARILGEIVLGGHLAAPVLRLGAIGLDELSDGAIPKELAAIARRCALHLERASSQWPRRGGAVAALGTAAGELLEELRTAGAAEVIHGAAAAMSAAPAGVLSAAIRLDRQLVGAQRQTPVATAFIALLESELTVLDRAFPPTTLTQLDHVRAVRVARQALVTGNLSIPRTWAAKVARFSRVPMDDLIQSGNEALLQATDNYDYRYGAPFAAYAYPWVKNLMSRSERHGGAVVLPLALHASRNRVRRALLAAEQTGAGIDAVASEVGLSVDQVEAIRANQIAASTDTDRTLAVAVDSAPGPDELAQLDDRRVVVLGVLSRLSRAHRELLTCYYGIGRPAMTMRAISAEMHLTTQRLYQLKAEGLRQLRHPSSRIRLADYAA